MSIWLWKRYFCTGDAAEPPLETLQVLQVLLGLETAELSMLAQGLDKPEGGWPGVVSLAVAVGTGEHPECGLHSCLLLFLLFRYKS